MKTTQLQKAKKQFLKDLYDDADFLQYKKNCIIDPSYGTSYGVLLSTNNNYVINKITPPAQTIIVNFLKEINGKENNNK